MSFTSRLLSKIYKFPPAETLDIAVERNLEIPMPDGIVLLADRYYPRNLEKRPTILIQSIYNTRTKKGYFAEIFAERGFQVVIVSGRGAFGSGGKITPFIKEREDGAEVLKWLKGQDWFNGELGTALGSYLGYTQWAIAHDAGPMLKAMSTQCTSSDFRSMVYPGDAFSQEIFTGWMSMVKSMKQSTFGLLKTVLVDSKKTKNNAFHLPLGDLDELTTGEKHDYWHDWLSHNEPGDKWWEQGNHSDIVSEVAAPNHMVTGWHDFMLPSMIRDYNLLKEGGHNPYLTIGPWTHYDSNCVFEGVREAAIWLRAHLLGDRQGLRTAPVRINVMGKNEWKEYSSWPPTDVEYKHYYFQSNGCLADVLPSNSEPDHYIYDPSDPTPSVGGFRAMGQGGPIEDNRTLEARSDVLTYTNDVLANDTEVIGPVSAELFVKSSLENTDFYVRICDVDQSGKSLNVCDGILRLSPNRPPHEPDGCRKITVELWPTAYCFLKGHRIRIQVSSGSFPRWNRNLGTGEPLETAVTMKVAEQYIYHDPEHPSAIILPFIK